jgi:hypothetical protein
MWNGTRRKNIWSFTLLYHIEGGRQVESKDDRTCRAIERETSKQEKTEEFHHGV